MEKVYSNREVSIIFEKIATLLEIKGENRFKIIAYRRAAENISSLGKDLKSITEDGTLRDIPGIGKAIGDKIYELISTGKLEFYEKLISEVPESLLVLAEIPELGPQRVRMLWKKLGISDLDVLEEAARNKNLQKLDGFGPKIESNILSGIQKVRKHPFQGRISLGRAWNTASVIIEKMKDKPWLDKISPAGSIRRMKDTIGDIDILVASRDAERVMEFFVGMEEVHEVILRGKTKTSIRIGSHLQVDLRVIAPESWGTALQYFTGNQEHNVQIREFALDRGYSLSEYCLRATSEDKEIFFENERSLYEFLGLSYIPPELRQGKGEINLARNGELPELLELNDIRGDLQFHTNWSDGKASLEEMAKAAMQRGLEYILVTDHSHGLGITGGVTPDDLVEQGREIDLLNEKYEGKMRVLKGVEVEVKADGSLDLKDQVLGSLDLVVAAVHSSLRQERERITERYIRAIENPYVHILAHPTGRLIGERDGADADWDRIFKAAASTGTLLEINATPQRLDLPDNLVRRARELECRFVVSTDAHVMEHFDFLFFGVGVARRAGLTAADILNTWPWEKLINWKKG